MKWARMVVFACGLAAGQDLTIRVNVNFVQLDVTVTDRNGKRIEDLNLEEFEVFRGGKRQKLKSVIYVPGKPPAAVPAREGGTVRSKTIRPQDVRRTIVLMVDDLSLSPASLVYAREAMKEFVRKSVEPGDLVAVYRSSSGFGLMQQLSSNREQLLRQIENVKFRRMMAMDPLAAMERNPLEESGDPTLARIAMEQRLQEVVDGRIRQDMLTGGMLNSVAGVVDGLREVPGRKSMVLFSESLQLVDTPLAMTNPGGGAMLSNVVGGMGGVRAITMAAMQRLIDRANRAGVMINTVDPRGLVITGLTAADRPSGDPRRMMGQMMERSVNLNLSQDGMIQLAEGTGGVSFRNSNDITGALESALSDQEGYYLIGFEPDDETFEKVRGGPKYQSLNVKVKRAGAKVRYRKGFFGVADEENADKRSPLMEAMVSPFVATDLPVRLTPICSLGPDQKPRLKLVVHVEAAGLGFDEVAAEDGKGEAWKQAQLDQLVVVMDAAGRVVKDMGRTFTLKFRGKGYEDVLRNGLVQELEVDLPAGGGYQVRTAIEDKKSGRRGSAIQYVETPIGDGKRLEMSDLVVTSGKWTEKGDPTGGPGMRQIEAGEPLHYAVIVYNARQPKVEMQVILYRDGKAVYTGPKTPFVADGHKPGDPLSITGQMKLGASSARGEYVIQVAVRDPQAPKNQQVALRSMDFELKP